MNSSGALLWFNWNILSEKGHRFYASFVYHQLIPLLSPNADRVISSCRLFDGDVLSMAQLPPVNETDKTVFRDISAQGLTNMYIIALFGDTDLGKLDTAMKKAVEGYSGMTSYPDIEFRLFYSYTVGLALIPSVAINGKEFKKVSFDFMSDEQLVSLGFKVIN